MSKSTVFVTICLWFFVNAAAATAATIPTLPAGKLAPETPAPAIDGRVDDEVWQTVDPQSSFTQQDPLEGEPATEKTEVRVLVGHGNVYVGIICYDSDPSKIIVSQSRRDAALTDVDSIILVFDTFNDSQNAFVFGTNPLGIEYDGQVSGEGQTGGTNFGTQGVSGSQRGGISAFNPNWDGDWTVRASITQRGWEAEMAIPLKTLRYGTGEGRTWGFNVMRNIRRKNEQVYLAPIPRGFDIYRVSLAAKLTELDLPPRRDLKLIPYALGSVNRDYVLAPDRQVDRDAAVGVDLKWGVTPNMTLDFTVNTDFAQVEADEEQVNLTRFDLFFPEKRPFFLENASTFQFGNPQQIDLFFSRRIGLSGLGASGVPIPIPVGARLSGKVGGWRTGFLNIQTDSEHDPNDNLLAPSNNFGVARVQREVGRSSFGGIFVNRQAMGKYAADDDWNRAYGVDANLAVTTNSRVFAFIAGTTSPGAVGTDTAARVFYDFRNNLWQLSGGYSQVGSRFNPEVGFLPRRGYRRPEVRAFWTYQPKKWQWIRRISPHANYDSYFDISTGDVQTARSHLHFFEIQPANGGRFGNFVDINTDNPLVPFVPYNTGGKRVVIPPGKYTWQQFASEYLSDPSAVFSVTFRHRIGGYYDGDFDSEEFTSNVRLGARFIGNVGWTRQHASLPGGTFTTHLVPMKASYAFTTLASIQALLQYNSQTSQFSSNIRLAVLNRSGTGLFVVYNDRQDTTDFTTIETLGRSFIVKYTRLLDF
jgi:uncharacterized protein DUF5916/cellulose/xylan binding protein with CBM9 domain